MLLQHDPKSSRGAGKVPDALQGRGRGWEGVVNKCWMGQGDCEDRLVPILSPAMTELPGCNL